jgi:hypothetical protein
MNYQMIEKCCSLALVSAKVVGRQAVALPFKYFLCDRAEAKHVCQAYSQRSFAYYSVVVQIIFLHEINIWSSTSLVRA